VAQYADIIEIVAPGEAQAGSRIDITVRVKNNHSAAIGIMVGGALEYGVSPWPEISLPEPSANVDSGVTYSFIGYFTMPDNKVTLHVYSYWYGADGYWYFDDEMTKVINPAAAIESQFGSIEIVSYERRL
jgi:hypothetical protein